MGSQGERLAFRLTSPSWGTITWQLIICTLALSALGQLRETDFRNDAEDRRFLLTVQISVTAARFPGRKLNLLVKLERRDLSESEISPGNATVADVDDPAFTNWATRQYSAPANPFDSRYPATDSLDSLARRFYNGQEPGSVTSETLISNEEFQSLPEGAYRAIVMDLDVCNSPLDCAVIAQSATIALRRLQESPIEFVTIQMTYAAVELGLRFIRCPSPRSQCLVPAHGVSVRANQSDIHGTEFRKQRPEDSAYMIDRNGYLLFGVFQSVRSTLQFSMGKFDMVLRPPVDVPVDSALAVHNIGVLDITESAIMCAPSPPGSPQQTAILGLSSGFIPETRLTAFIPGLQCFWQIIPGQEASAINLHFMKMASSHHSNSKSLLQIYSRAGAGDFQLAYEVRGLAKNIITVPGSQVLLHFIASEAEEAGEGFYLAWSATPSGQSLDASTESWFDKRLAVILFATFAAVSYVIASIAAWKWWRQRVLQQEQEAARLEAREQQRSERRRHRHENRRRRTRGLPVDLVSRLPTANVKLAELDRDEGEEPSCSICLCEYEEDDKVTWLPCSHSFHTSCISSWLKNSLICPICKDNVKRSLLKTLSMYRELHRTGIPDPPSSFAGPRRSMPPAAPLTGSAPATEYFEMAVQQQRMAQEENHAQIHSVPQRSERTGQDSDHGQIPDDLGSEALGDYEASSLQIGASLGSVEILTPIAQNVDLHNETPSIQQDISTNIRGDQQV